MKKRILSILLTLCMVICLVPTSVFAEGDTAETVDITGSGTQDDPYLIYTVEGLKAFRDKANSGELYAFATLMNDIVLNDGTFDADGNYTATDGSAAEPEKWTPIGTDNKQYRGTFDGNGKTVKGLYVNTGGDEPVGLFGFTGGPKIRNLTVDGCVIGKDWAGGILGFSHGGVIENCTNNASVTVANLDSDRQACVGGIAGVTYAKLIGCGNTGKITVKNVAQIANVGGIVGCQNNMGLPIIHDCYNTGDVSGEAGTLYLGGIAGAIAQGVVSNCYSIGMLDSTGSTTVYLGGIVGLNCALYDLTNNYYLEGTADKAAGRDEAEAIDKNTVKPMPKEAFEDGTVLDLIINGREDGTHPWGGECGYVESAGMVLPILKREESLYAHTHCVCGTGTKFDGHDTHTDVTWTPWAKTNGLPTKSGYYFLTDDVVMNIDQTTSSEGVYICLNGYGIKIADTEDESNNPALLLNGGTLTVTDCGTNGTVNDITIYSGKLMMYGGTVPAGSKLTVAGSGELFAAGNAAFNGTVINQGTVSAGTFDGEVINETGTINGGTFNGKVTSSGGTINNGTFNGVVDLYRYPTRNGDSAVQVNNGIFSESSTVNNSGSSIYGGTYSGKVTVTGYINPFTGGGMTGFIGGGTFTKTSEVTALTTNPGNLVGMVIYGDYYGKVRLEGGVIDDRSSEKCPVFHESSEVYFTSGYADGGIYYGTEIYGDAKIGSGAYCILVFKAQGGSEVPEQKVLRGKKAAPLAENPTKAGYVFSGWLKNGTPFDLTGTLLIDYYVELTAVWIECDHSGNTAQPTCTEPVACTVCGGTIAALGHDFSGQGHNEDTHWEKCSRCDAKNNENPHVWDSGKVTVKPTCITKGEKIYTCDKCGATKSDSIPASGHRWAREWQHDDTHHWHECLNDYCDWKDNDSLKDGYAAHTGEATCTHKGVCDVCGEEYGDLNPENHTGEEKWEKTETGHTKKWDCCGAVSVEEADHEFGNGVCKVCGYTCDHKGGEATCKDKAVCEVCGKAYGELDKDNHSNLKHIEAKAATKTAEGNIEYWYCEDCGKYYSNADANKEITKADAVTAKLPDDSKSPKTGDIGGRMLWIALLFTSGGVAIGITVIGKKKKRL